MATTAGPAARGRRAARLCLNMIVKDEAAIIGRCLSSVADHVDAYVIGDTGSTDGTPEAIERFFAGRGIPGELHRFPFETFGQARNEALGRARASALPGDYLLLVDADMELVVHDPAFRDGLAAPAYRMVQRAGVSYRNMRLLGRDTPGAVPGRHARTPRRAGGRRRGPGRRLLHRPRLRVEPLGQVRARHRPPARRHRGGPRRGALHVLPRPVLPRRGPLRGGGARLRPPGRPRRLGRGGVVLHAGRSPLPAGARARGRVRREGAGGLGQAAPSGRTPARRGPPLSPARPEPRRRPGGRGGARHPLPGRRRAVHRGRRLRRRPRRRLRDQRLPLGLDGAEGPWAADLRRARAVARRARGAPRHGAAQPRLLCPAPRRGGGRRRAPAPRPRARARMGGDEPVGDAVAGRAVDGPAQRELRPARRDLRDGRRRPDRDPELPRRARRGARHRVLGGDPGRRRPAGGLPPRPRLRGHAPHRSSATRSGVPPRCATPTPRAGANRCWGASAGRVAVAPAASPTSGASPTPSRGGTRRTGPP